MNDLFKNLRDMNMKSLIVLITYTILLIMALVNIRDVLYVVSKIFSLLSPFITGFVLAYIFNIPMQFFMKKLPEKLKTGRRIIAGILALVCILAFIVFVVSIIVPQLVDNIRLFISEFPGYVNTTETVIKEMLERYGMTDIVISQLEIYNQQIQSMVLDFATNILPKIMNITTIAIEKIKNLGMALVIAVYFVISKDTLLKQVNKVCQAFMNCSTYKKGKEIVDLTNSTFSNFISGQMLEACIIAVLCYIGASLLQIEYPLILSVIIGCTNIIPIFGPIIGTILCGILLLIVNPLHVFVFVIFGIILQQFECNIIYPRVVGSSVGLSGVWVLLAITVGGGLFGVIGMVFGLPMFAVVYRLFANEVNKRLKEKGIIKPNNEIESEEIGMTVHFTNRENEEE